MRDLISKVLSGGRDKGDDDAKGETAKTKPRLTPNSNPTIQCPPHDGVGIGLYLDFCGRAVA